MKNNSHPKILFAATSVKKCARDRPQRVSRDSTLDSTIRVIPTIGKDGRIDKLMMRTKEASN